MKLILLTIFLLLGGAPIVAGSKSKSKPKSKYVYYTGTVQKVSKSKGGLVFLDVKTDKKYEISFVPDKVIKNKEGKLVHDPAFQKRVLALKPGQRIKIKRIPRDCDCMCFIGFKILEKKK